MPAIPPPPRCPGAIVFRHLEAGSRVWRVHSSRWDADSFNPSAAPSVLRGGRFDSVDGSFAYTYVGEDEEAAVAETIMRDLPFDGHPRIVLKTRFEDKFVTGVEVLRQLSLVSLLGADLTQVGQDLWLTKCDADEYLLTRAWSAAIRGWAPNADGFVYRCRHDEERLAYVLFDDGDVPVSRARGSLRATLDTLSLRSPGGLEVLRRVASRHNASLP